MALVASDSASPMPLTQQRVLDRSEQQMFVEGLCAAGLSFCPRDETLRGETLGPGVWTSSRACGGVGLGAWGPAFRGRSAVSDRRLAVLGRVTSQAMPAPLSCAGRSLAMMAGTAFPAPGLGLRGLTGAAAILMGGETEALEGEGMPTARWKQGWRVCVPVCRQAWVGPARVLGPNSLQLQ